MQQNATVSQNLSADQVLAIGFLMAGGSVTAVAKQIGLDRSTIYRWLHEDEIFVSELNQAKQEQLQSVRAELSLLARDATRTFRELLADPDSPGSVKLKTAIVVLQALGALVPESIGYTDPEQIRSEKATKRLLSFI